MPWDFGVLSFVCGAIKLSWIIYEKGFTEEKSLPRRYLEFGDALFRLHWSLNTIESIVRTANTGLENERLESYGPELYDTTALIDIVGNFRLTLEQCQQLLNDVSKFRTGKDGFITNIIYNLNTDAQVRDLTERLKYHSVKIGLVLDAFNIHVQTQLRDLHNEQHQDLAERIQELKHLLVASRDSSTDAYQPVIKRDIEVPVELAERFTAELQQRSLLYTFDWEKTSDGLQVSVREGLEAFCNHFNRVRPDGDATSYLRLLKSIWLMDKIREGHDWSSIQSSNPGGLYDRCIREMDRRLRIECARIASSPIARPRLSTIMRSPEEMLAIWPRPISINDNVHETNLGVLLDISLVSGTQTHTFRVVRNMDGTLGMEDTTTTITSCTGGSSRDRVTQRLNLDPRKVFLVPVYAIPTVPGSQDASCSVKLQSSPDDTNGLTPEFRSCTDLFRLQHLITGYRCVHQRRTVIVTSLVKGQTFPMTGGASETRPRKTTEVLTEIGNIQLWQKASFEKRPASQHQYSRSSEDLLNSSETVSGAWSPEPLSERTFTSTSSIMSNISSAHSKEISLGSAVRAVQLTQPEPPLLVVFLKQPDTGQLSFLVIELDERTKIEPKSCDCRNTKASCTVSVLERSGKPLLARRFYAKKGLNSWNLAAVGAHWSSSDTGAVCVRDMYWLRFEFSNDAERKKFHQNVTDLVRIFSARMNDYQRDLRSVRGAHIISRPG